MKEQVIERYYIETVEIVRREGRASTSFLQRKLRIGYLTACYLMDEMEAQKVIGPKNGPKPREAIPTP